PFEDAPPGEAAEAHEPRGADAAGDGPRADAEHDPERVRDVARQHGLGEMAPEPAFGRERLPNDGGQRQRHRPREPKPEDSPAAARVAPRARAQGPSVSSPAAGRESGKTSARTDDVLPTIGIPEP